MSQDLKKSICGMESIIWRNDKFILWALCYVPRDEIGYNFRRFIIENIKDRKYGSKLLRNKIELHENWYKNEINSTAGIYSDTINYDTIGQDKSDPVYISLNEFNVEKYENDPKKKIFCKFLKEKECNKGAACTYSHHPSILWNDIVQNIKPWIKCDIPPWMFGLVFSISGKLMNEYDVIIKVPKSDDKEEYLVKLQGNLKNIRECVEKLSNILKRRISILTDEEKPSFKTNEKIHIMMEKNEKFLDIIDLNIIGMHLEDPILEKCEELKIQISENNYDKKKYKTQFCSFFRSSYCKNDSTCTYSHHPSLFWTYAPGEWHKL